MAICLELERQGGPTSAMLLDDDDEWRVEPRTNDGCWRVVRASFAEE